MKSKRVVVTGLGAITSLGLNKDIFWENLIKGVSGISKVTLFDTVNHFAHFGGEVRGFIPENFVHQRKVRFIGKASQFAIAAAKMALDDAGFVPGSLPEERTAVYLGTTSGESQEIEEMDGAWLKQGADVLHDHEMMHPASIIRYMVNSVSSNVAVELDVSGPNRMFTTACAAGNYAIGYGYDTLRSGKADIVIAGGADVFSYIVYTGFNQLMSVAPEKCQPFDKNRRGMIPAEGAGVLVLETLDDAVKRGAPIYAEILGYGLSCDAFHVTQPQVDGITQCMQNALRETDLTPDDIDYICAHGTGTKANDKTESAAIKRVFGDRRVAVSSIKSMLGHTMGAASALEALACCLSVKHDIIPPTINFETPDPECDIDCVPNAARKQPVRIALNNAFAFGGNNSCLVIKKFEH